MKRGSQKSAFWISNRGLDIYWILSIRVLVLVKVYRVKTNGKTGNKKNHVSVSWSKFRRFTLNSVSLFSWDSLSGRSFR